MKYKQSKMIFTSVVAAILILSPLAPVFAQETTTPDTGASAPAANLEAPAATMGPADTNNTDIDPNDPKIDADDSTDNTGVEAAKTADNPASVDSSVSPNSLTIGTPPENENKKLADVTLPNTDKANGTFSYKYPITVPPGRNGLQPSVNLAYSSQEKKDGIVGVAWSVDTPYIERVNKQGLERLYTDNNFRSSMDGELVGIDSTNYGPKVENGSFSKYSFSSNTWTVTDKNGTVYTFGSQAATRLDDPSDSSRVYRWMLEEVRDTNDNFITYEYYKDAGQIYPSKITYTGNGTTAGIFTVNFDRTSRAHSFTSYATGFAVTTNYLISQIRTEVSSVWARKYNLAYTTADNGVSVLLDTITESGQDDDNQVTTLPPTNFDYKVSDPGWTYDEGTYLQPPHAEGHGIDDFGGRFADINGDGLVDYICHNNATLVAACTRNSPEIYINNGTRFVSGSGWHFPLVAGIGPETEYFLDINMSDSGLRIVDVNGDGLPDLVKGLKQHGEPDIEYVYINNGVDGWDYSSTWTLPVPVIDNGNDKGTRFADINGDGLVDILCHNLSVSGDWNCSQTNPKIYLNTGSGWAETTAWKLPITGDSGTIREAFADGDHEDTGTRIIDLNGDGLPDLVNTRGSTRNVYWNNGRSGWDYDTTTTLVPPYSYELGPHDIGERSMDVNNDGLPDDLCHNDSAHGDCRSDNPQIHINTGVTYAPSSWRFPQIKDTEIVSEYFTDSNYDDAGLRILDMDGDGLPDLYNQYDSDTPLYFNNNVIDSNLLTKITYPEGGSTEISYKATGKLQDSSGNVLNPNLPIVFDVVSEITNDDGLGNTYSKSYSYTGGKYYFGDYLDRKFAGFKTVTETDGAGNVTVTYYHQGDDSDSAHGEYDDDIAKAGKPYRIEVYDDAGNLYSATINKWDEYNLGTGRDFVKLAQTVTAAYDGDSTHKDTAVAYTYDNANGNLTQKIEYGEVAGSDDGTFTDTGTDDFTTVYSYATDGADLVGLPDDVIVTDHDFATVKEDRYYYDGQSLGTATVGNQTQHDMWTDGTNYVHTQKAYDGTYGLTIVDTDERGKTTGYSYDSYNLYPVAVTNALAQTTDYTYDYSSGQAEQTTDPNSLVTLSVYDGLDRLLEQQQPDLAAHASLVAKATYIYTDTAGAVSVHQTDNLDAATARETYQYFDGLGRLIQERKEAEGTNYEVTDKAYNNLGLLEKESLPYFSAGSSKTSPTETADLYTTTTYDPLSRVASVTNSAGTTANAYADWELAVTDPNGVEKDLYKDAYGNLIQVDEHNGEEIYSTAYTYDYLGDLTKITDALGNVRNFTYNGLGRRLAAEDLHAAADAYFGSYSYTYDDAGNLTEVADPNANTIDYTYDDLNRKLTEDHIGQAGTEVTNTYDQGSDGIGHLTSIVTPDLSQTDTYDANGNLASETKTINAGNYETDYAYDRQGNQILITNPDGSAIQYLYNSAGLVEKVQQEEDGGSFADVVSNFDYSPTEKETTIAYANGTTTTNTYDPAKLYRLAQKVTTDGTTDFQNLSYTYDSNGNVTEIVDASDTDSAKTANYTYDDLNRLTEANISAAAAGQSTYDQTYTYNAIGDLLTKSDGAGTYSYDGNAGTSYANPHAVTSIDSDTYTYDDNGNLTAASGEESGPAAITLDATSTNITNNYNETITKTWSHTTSSGDDRLLVLTADLWQDVAGTGSITAASYNGVALTKAASARHSGMESEVWYLVNPPSGSHTVSVTVTGDTDAIKLAASTFTGVDQTSPYVDSATATGESGSPSVSRTTTSANSLLVATLSRYDTATAATNQISLYNNHGGSTLGAASYQITSATGLYSDTYAGASPNDWSMVASEFKPASSGSGSSSLSNTWDYNNRLIQSNNGTVVDSYTYDPTGQRLTLDNGTATTIYPSKYYNVTGTSATEHIMTPDGLLLATVETTAGEEGGSAGIAPDATSTSITNTYHETITKNWSHTTGSDDNRLLVLSADLWQDVAGTGSITSASYNGVALTKAASARHSGMESEVWYLANPDTGSHTISVTVTGDTDAIKLSAATFIGVDQANPYVDSNTATGESGNPSVSRTTTVDDSLLVATLSRYDTATATTDQTSLYNNHGGSTLGAASYQLASTAGSYSDTYTGASPNDWSMVMSEFRPATTEGEEGSTTIHYIYTDHLTGSNVITDNSGAIDEALDYYPYGSTRLDEKTGSFDEQRKFAGHEYDTDTQLSYMGARYYSGNIGRFVSEDPVFLAVGDNNQVKELTQNELQQILADPQNLNSYAYGRNNPLSYQDPSGQWSINIFGFLPQSTQVSIGDGANYLYNNNAAWKTALNNPYAAGAAIGVASGAATYAGAAGLANLSANYLGGIGTACLAFCSQPDKINYNNAVDWVSTKFGADPSSLPTKSEVNSVMDKWVNTNMSDKMSSILYHFNKHADGGSLSELTQNGLKVWNSYVNNSSEVQRVAGSALKNGETGLRIDLSSGAGGIFTKSGGIVSTWYR